MSEPFARDEDRRADMEPERVVLERRPVPIPHQEPDQSLVGLFHDVLATGEADPGGVHDREVGRHRVVEPHEPVVEDTDGVFGYHSVRRGHGSSEFSRGACRHLRLVLPLVEAGVLPTRDRFEGVPPLLRRPLLDGRAEHHRLPHSGRGAVRALGGADAAGLSLRAEARGQPSRAACRLRPAHWRTRRPARADPRLADQRRETRA